MARWRAACDRRASSSGSASRSRAARSVVVRVLTAVVAMGGSVTAVALARAARRAESGTRALGLRARLPWRVPARWRVPPAAALHAADVRLEPEVALQAWLAGVATCALVAAWIAPVLMVPATVAGAAAGPVALRLGRSRRERRFASTLPGSLELVGQELRGGNTVSGAL